jgi:AmpD protein
VKDSRAIRPTIHEFPSPHFDERPLLCGIDTVVLHCMYAPGAKAPFELKKCIAALDKARVSAHFLISRRGKIAQLVPPEKRAWHAGVSRMPFTNDARENVNHFSIGVELIGTPEGSFTASQYRALGQLLKLLSKRFPLRALVGHDVIAPGRKVDPGKALDVAEVRRLLSASRLKNLRLCFSFS